MGCGASTAAVAPAPPPLEGAALDEARESVRLKQEIAPLQRENATNGGDMLCLHAVPLDAGKLKGPSLSVVAWFELVLAMNKDHGDRRSHFVATVDDDAYIHVPGVHRRRESDHQTSHALSTVLCKLPMDDR